MPTKQQRLREFFRRLEAAPPAATYQEARQLIADTLNRVEDESSGVPNNPGTWIADGRMYPPEEDSIRAVPNRPDLVRFRNREHDTFVQSNGAIAIVEFTSRVRVLDKAGADGKRIDQQVTR